MLLQIASFEEDAAGLEEGSRHVREEVVPSIQGAEGLVAGYWAIDRQDGKRVSIMVWQAPRRRGPPCPRWSRRSSSGGRMREEPRPKRPPPPCSGSRSSPASKL